MPSGFRVGVQNVSQLKFIVLKVQRTTKHLNCNEEEGIGHGIDDGRMRLVVNVSVNNGDDDDGDDDVVTVVVVTVLKLSIILHT